MEKIQRALDKARVQREAAGSAPQTSTRTKTLISKPPEKIAATPSALAEGSRESPYRQIAAIPSRALVRRRIVAAASGGATDAFRMLRTQVLGRLEQAGGGGLAISSPKQGDGKTLVAVNLAVSIARHMHRRALLVDLDFRRPGIAKLLGVTPEVSLSDHLQGSVPLADCLLDIGVDRFLALPQAHSVEHSSELLASPRMTALAAELARDPDRIVIYDCPPLLATDDAMISLGFATGCLLVLREGRTTRSELLRAAELVGEERLLGTVLNGAVWSFASGYETHVYYGNA